MAHFVDRDGDAFATASRIVPAVASPLLSIVPGLSDRPKARRNFADGTLLAEVGTLDVAAHYATGKGATNYMKGGFLEPTEFTVCAILKQDDTNAGNSTRGTVLGSFTASNFGLLIYWQSASNLRFQVYQATNAVKVADLAPTSPGTLHRFSWICTASLLTAINETDAPGTLVTTAITAARQPGTLPVNIFSSQSGSYTGLQGCYSLDFWPYALTSNQRAAHWVRMAALAAHQGVTVA